MLFQSIMALNLFGIILLLFLIISRFSTRQRRRLGDKFFMALVLLTVGASIVEIFSFWIDGKPGRLSYWLNVLCNTGLYMANIIGCFIWLLYVDLKLYRDRKRLHRVLPIYAIFPSVNVIALLVNIFTGFLFYVDENNIYHRTPICMLLYVFVFLTGMESLVIYYGYRRKHSVLKFFPIWMFMAPVIAGCIAQGLFYGISTAWPSTAIGICAIHIGVLNEKSFVDSLTGLYNRQYLEHTIIVFSETKSFYGIMLDLNHFKRINDNYGHSVGYRALFMAGRLIRRAVGKNGSSFRFAGDEFIILLNSDSEADAVAVEEQVRIAADVFNADSNQPFRLSFSMGHAKCSRGDSQDDFLRRMDTEMYKDKVRMHRLEEEEDRVEA